MTHVAFDSPWYLLLLAALPLVWWLSYGSLSGLGRVRRVLAIALRSAVFMLLVLALAEAQWVRTSDRITVIYLLDQSLSVSQAQSDAAIRYINASIAQQRDPARTDEAGVIVFGTDPAIELPPLDETQKIGRVETLVDREHTNLAGAMKLALACFPHDCEKRIVILSDGNQNIGDALVQARAMAEASIGIDVVPLHARAFGEVSVEKVTIPSDVRKGQPFDLSIVLNNKGGRRRPARTGRRPPAGRPPLGQPGTDDRRPGAGARAGAAGVSRPRGDRRTRLLHLRGPLRPQEPGRRHDAAEQPSPRRSPTSAAAARCWCWKATSRKARASSICSSSGCGP